MLWWGGKKEALAEREGLLPHSLPSCCQKIVIVRKFSPKTTKTTKLRVESSDNIRNSRAKSKLKTSTAVFHKKDLFLFFFIIHSNVDQFTQNF